MKILILEYITGGGMRQEPISSSLAVEGAWMLRALIDDFLALSSNLPNLKLIVMSDDRLPLPSNNDRIHIVNIGAGDPFRGIWREWISRCDAVWPIAPETGGVLEQLCLDVETAGKPLLTSPSAAVRLAASKLETATRLAKFGLPVARTVALNEWKPKEGQPFVVKPDDGVGCEGVRIIRDPARFEMPAGMEGWIAQPLIEGDSLSLSVLFAHGRARLLSCNRQLIELAGGRFVLNGCLVNAIADKDWDGLWQVLAEHVAHALPELWGYAGIDLILAEDGPTILEINPRLTTSYAGLRLATGENPADMVLNLFETGNLPPLRTHNGGAVEIRLDHAHGH